MKRLMSLLMPRARRLWRLAPIAVFAAAIMVPSLAIGGPAQAATSAGPAASTGVALTTTVVPNAAVSQCGTGTSSGNVKTCLTVNKTGTQINNMTATATVINNSRQLQVCIRGPQGSLGCTPSSTGFKTVDKGGIIAFTAPTNVFPSGQYCANTYRYNADDGTHTEIGHECMNE
jgi:hypothetical protein